MVDAPEKIWADHGPRGGLMFRETRMPDSIAEYTRTDIAERQIAEMRDHCNAMEVEHRQAIEEMQSTLAENARLKALPLKDEVERAVDVDALAQEIRRVDGSNSLGAGALAEALLPFLSRLRAGAQEGWRDIPSAPKDGTLILLWLSEPYSKPVVGRWYEPWENWQAGALPHDPAREERYGIGSAVPIAWQPIASPSVSDGGSRNG